MAAQSCQQSSSSNSWTRRTFCHVNGRLTVVTLQDARPPIYLIGLFLSDSSLPLHLVIYGFVPMFFKVAQLRERLCMDEMEVRDIGKVKVLIWVIHWPPFLLSQTALAVSLRFGSNIQSHICLTRVEIWGKFTESGVCWAGRATLGFPRGTAAPLYHF